MTVEELNVKITADASGFKSEVANVNESLEQLRRKLRQAGAEATAAFSGMMKLSAEVGGDTAESGSVTVDGASESGTDKRASYFPSGAPSYLNTMIPAATVPSFRRGETVMGAIRDNTEAISSASAQPIQINTTVELDGDAVGQSVNRFNARQNRIYNE